MKTKDHLLLGKYLWRRYAGQSTPVRRAAFFAGCVEPDMNVLTYLRGSIRCEKFHGHHFGNTCRHISRCLRKLREKTHWNTWDYFVFGTVVHYVADAFTYPHNPSFSGSLAAHRNYERRLHRIIRSMINSCNRNDFDIPFTKVQPFLDQMHESYVRRPGEMETDSIYILDACCCLFQNAMVFLKCSSVSGSKHRYMSGSKHEYVSDSQHKSENVPYESTYYNGLI